MTYKTIREVIEITGITENALRYYDEKAVLNPSVKSETGRREWLYDDDAIWSIRLVMLYRKLGLSVEETGTVIKMQENSKAEILEEKLKALKAERDELDSKITIAAMLVMIENLAAEGKKDESHLLLEELIKRTSEKEEN